MILHGGDYCPEQWKNDFETVRSDIKAFKEANINCITLGMFSWSSIETSEGNFDTEWFSKVLDIIEEHDMKFILGTASAARPHWLAQKYPETSRVNKHEQREKSGQRHNHCMTSQLYRKKVEIIVTKQLEVALKYPNLHSIHINNELNGYCYCESCTTSFQDYLKEKYGTIEELNQQWWNTFWSHTYNNFSEITPPFEHGEQSNTSLLINWEKFMTQAHCDYIDYEVSVIRQHTDLPVTTNYCGTPFCTVIDYYEMTKHIDYISYDIYPSWNIKDNFEVAIAAKKDLLTQRGLDLDKRFLIMESTPSGADWQSHTMLKSAKLHEASTLLQVMTGAEATLYFQLKQSRGSCEKFHGNVLDVNGDKSQRVYKYVKEFGRKLGELDFITNANYKHEVAIYINWNDFNAIRHSSGPRKDDYNLESFYDNIIEYFNNININCTFVYDENKLEEFETIIIPFGYAISDDILNKIKGLQHKKVIAFPMLGYVDTDDKLHLGKSPHLMTDAFGIEILEFTALTDDYGLRDESYDYETLAESTKLTDAGSLGTFVDDILDNSISKNIFNDSEYFYISAFPKRKSLFKLFDKIFNATYRDNDKLIRTKFILNNEEILFVINFGEEVKISNSIWHSGEQIDVLGKYECAITRNGSDAD